MNEEVFRFTAQDDELMRSLEKQEKQLIETGKAADSMGDAVAQSFNESAAAADNFSQQMDKNAKATAAQAATLGESQKNLSSWRASLKESVSGTQVFGKSLGEWKAQLLSVNKAQDAGAVSTGKLSGAWRVFNNVLKVSIIGAIIAGVIALISYLSKLQPVVDFVSRVMASFNAVLAEAGKRIATVVEITGKLLQGDFKGAFKQYAEVTLGFADALKTAATEAYNLEQRLQNLRDAQIKASVQNAADLKRLEQLQKIGNDETTATGERIKALKELQNVNDDYTKRNLELAAQRIVAAQDEIRLYGDNVERQKALSDAQIAFLEIQSERTSRQMESEQEIRQIRKQAAAERQKQLDEEKKAAQALAKEYEKLFDSIKAQSDALEIENIFNPVERVLAEFEAAKGQINEIRERLLEIAPDAAARARVEEEVEKLFDQLLIKYREEYAAAADELEKLKGGKIREALNPLPPLQTLKRDITETLGQISQAADEFIEGQKPLSLAKMLGISEDSLEGLKDATAQIIDSLGQIADARVKEAEAATKAADERVRAAESALIREQELALQGFANDRDLREQQLAEAKAQREAALKEEAKARRAQILLDSAGQISALLTSSANIFKALSPIPFAGIPLAIATIGVMFAAFGKAKADALKAAAVPKFRKGTRLKGHSHEEGGLAISDEHGNVVGEAEGDEWLIGTRPSREHDRFLERLNNNEFQGVNLDRLFRPSASNPLTEAAPRIDRIEKDFREVRETQHTAALAMAYHAAAENIVRAIEEKEVVMPLKDYKIMKKRGRNTYTTIVREEK